MFDIGWPELFIVMAIALLVIGPRELPNAIRTVMSIMRKLRMAAREFQSGLDDIARESGMDEVKQQLDDIEYYDPGEALKSIADADKDLLGLDDDPDMLAGNSIFDSNADFTPPDEGGRKGDEENKDPQEAAASNAKGADEGDPKAKPTARGTST